MAKSKEEAAVEDVVDKLSKAFVVTKISIADGLEKGMIEELVHGSKKTIKNARNQESRRTPAGAAMVLTSPFCTLRPDDLKTPEVDARLTEDLLVQKLGFVAVSKELPRTLKYWDAKKMFADISQLELAHYPSFLFYYSGHGDESGILLPSGDLFGYREVVDSVCRCRSLQEKPKVFIFDCSRIKVAASLGVSCERREQRIGSCPAERQRLTESDLPHDCLVVFAAGHHQSAVGRRGEGSTFTNYFVEAVSNHIDDNVPVNFEKALADVCKRVRQFVIRIPGHGRPQEPEVLSTLSQRVPIMLPSLGKCRMNVHTSCPYCTGVSVMYHCHCKDTFPAQH